MFVLTRKNYDRKKRYSQLAGYVFRRVQITTGKKNTTRKKRYSHLAVIWKLEKNTSGKKGTVVWSSVGAQNTKHNTYHKHNNQQDEPCHPALQRLCSLSLHGGSSGATKSWCRHSPTPCAGRNPSGLRSLSLVCLLGEAKW